MKHYHDFQYTVDENGIEDLLNQLGIRNLGAPDTDILPTLFSLIDLTSLSEKDNAENIGRLCEQVNLLHESYPGLTSPAALCVYPELVPVVKEKLGNPLINIVSVGGGFPSSQTFLEIKIREISLAVESGADEIDAVLPVGKFQLGLYEEISQEFKSMKSILGTRHLKVCLETGSLRDLTEVRRASLLAMDAGADFIETSTGMAGPGAEPASFAVMCIAIRDFYSKTGRKTGIKLTGELSDVKHSYMFYFLVRSILGEEWLNPDLFRIGGSKLANQLIRAIHGKEESFNYFH